MARRASGLGGARLLVQAIEERAPIAEALERGAKTFAGARDRGVEQQCLAPAGQGQVRPRQGSGEQRGLSRQQTRALPGPAWLGQRVVDQGHLLFGGAQRFRQLESARACRLVRGLELEHAAEVHQGLRASLELRGQQLRQLEAKPDLFGAGPHGELALERARQRRVVVLRTVQALQGLERAKLARATHQRLA